MGVLTREELDGLYQEVFRRYHLWAMHETFETPSERRPLGQYTDTELLYSDLTSGFDDAEADATSRQDLLARVEALTPSRFVRRNARVWNSMRWWRRSSARFGEHDDERRQRRQSHGADVHRGSQRRLALRRAPSRGFRQPADVRAPWRWSQSPRRLRDRGRAVRAAR